jgi:hypothetical protein
MNIKDLVPVSRLASSSGVKMLAYGAPGSGKTPIAATAPRPVILATEAGMLSMRGVDHIPAYKADTAPRIDDFMKWWFESAEAKAFDTLVMDSISHAANVVLAHEKTTTKHGPAAYGQMAEKVYGWAERIFTQPEKHAYLICQQGTVEEAGIQKRRPIFAGQDLNARIPHLYDVIAHVGPASIPGMKGPVTAIRCQGSFDIMARDRSGRLAEYEPPNLKNIFDKMFS